MWSDCPDADVPLSVGHWLRVKRKNGKGDREYDCKDRTEDHLFVWFSVVVPVIQGDNTNIPPVP